MEGLQPCHAYDHSTGIMRDGPPLPGGAHRHIPLGFRDIKAYTTRHVNQRNSCLPALAATGSRAPDNGTGLRSPGR
jgi:hypothetical protein